MDYIRDDHYVYKCTYHIVFCPKYRRKILTDGIEKRLKELISEISIKKNFNILSMEVMPDHVHLLLSVHPELGILDLVKSIKKTTAVQLKKEFPSINKRLPNLWTRSAFIATTGSVSMETVKQYIENQKNK